MMFHLLLLLTCGYHSLCLDREAKEETAQQRGYHAETKQILSHVTIPYL